MPAWREQALIQAPVGDVWKLVGDPTRYPEWAGNVVSVTGLAELAETETFEQVTHMPLSGDQTTIFEVEKLDDLHEIRLRCQSSGYYSRWVLTPAQTATFAEVEIGVEPTAAQHRLYFGLLGKRFMRKVAVDAIDGVRRQLGPGEPED